MVSLVIVETVTEQILTDELLASADRQITPCIQARNATWRYSLLSSDRHRMICIYDAPDAESIRDAYRRGGLASSRAWAGYVIQPEGTTLPTWNESTLKIQESTYPTGLTDEQCNKERQHLLPCYAEYGVEWIRSYVSLDTTRVLCELNAPDAEVIRHAHRRFGFPCDRVWSAQVFGP
ncbi:MAG: DUF4242 domain-containing protein [Cyanobacteriota bacterium]|nr:DUF4242 domain-containing protein [Cyanobacteriota bacterium]